MIALILTSCSKAEKVETGSASLLPYYEEATFTPIWYEEGSLPADFHQIPEFSLINQSGEEITEKSITGKISIVDFFFTSCPGICPKTTANMTLVQNEFLKDDEVILLSHSVTPVYDSVAVLKEYAEEKGIVPGKWHLLTGSRAEIYTLGRDAYFAEEDLGLMKSPDDFLHTENFILLDGNRQIRGIYNGLNTTSINQLIEDVKTLRKTL
ncbi:hypothetical protein GCM10009119_01560 [Algoriphagus jejuensis]|uniref:Thioredoxin domain-containing protein n=2 Tax=Algoriphagus jejuensis TaxID=419934 RepID=A0ABP3Y8L7_9BACT